MDETERSTSSESHVAGHEYVLAGFVVLTVFFVLFPFWRERADWRYTNTGENANPVIANRFDRWYFGYIPIGWGWIGSPPDIYRNPVLENSIGGTPGHGATLGSVTCVAQPSYASVDWDIVNAQLLIVWGVWFWVIGRKLRYARVFGLVIFLLVFRFLGFCCSPTVLSFF